MKLTLSSRLHYYNTLLAAGFCERWPKAWRGGFAPVRGQLLIMAKNLPLTIQMFAFGR
jgi:hypothetical protein